MLTRVRETRHATYRVSLHDADGEQGHRETANLAEAFAWQQAGEFPVAPKAEPEAVRSKKK